MMRLVRFTIAICLSASGMFAAAESFDDAAQCPDKASPRRDIVKCYTFDEALDSCVTGKERSCVMANGYDGAMKPTYAIRRGGGAAVGGGFLEDVPDWGSTGSFMAYSLPEGQREISVRYYQRWGAGSMDYPGGNNHTMSIGIEGGIGPCARDLGIDGDQRGHIAVADGGCSPGIVKLWDDDLHNGRWYLIEFYGRMETSCTDNTRLDGCNGFFAVYLDGVKKLERNNWNWGGGSSTATFDNILLPRTYYQVGFPRWQPRLAWDNIVVGDSAASRIGPARLENSRGVPIGRIYYQSAGAEPFVHRTTDPTKSYMPQSDCSARSGGALGFNASFTRGLMGLDTLNSNVRDWLSETRCEFSSAYIDGSMKVNVPPTSDARSSYMHVNANAVIGNVPLAVSGNDSIVGGSIYIHPGSDFRDRPILAGHMSGGPRCRGSICQWIGLTIDDGRWALAERFTSDSPDSMVFARGTPATKGEWHSFEVVVFKGGVVDLWIDGVKVIDRARTPNAPGGASNLGFFGLSHLPTRVPLFAVNFDDMYWSTVSRETCYGDWGTDCPSSAVGSVRPPTSTVRPLPPVGVN